MIRAIAVAVLFMGGAARAGVADRVRAEGVLRCGAVFRPGIAAPLAGGSAAGVAVDLCRAVAVAVLGPRGRVVFSIYDGPHDFDAVRSGRDELAFLTGGEIAEQKLGGAVLPGPVAAVLAVGVMVPEASAVQHVAGLVDQVVCLMTGSVGQRALDRLGLEVSRMAFQEDVEMLDAYNAGRCGAVVGETTALAAMRRSPGVRGVASRLLPEPIAMDSLVVVSTVKDGGWAAAAAWVIHALALGDTGVLPVDRVAGLRDGWRGSVRATVGDYAAISRRNLEPLGLPPERLSALSIK